MAKLPEQMSSQHAVLPVNSLPWNHGFININCFGRSIFFSRTCSGLYLDHCLPVGVPWIRTRHAYAFLNLSFGKMIECRFGDSEVSDESRAMPKLQAFTDDLTITPSVSRHGCKFWDIQDVVGRLHTSQRKHILASNLPIWSRNGQMAYHYVLICSAGQQSLHNFCH